MLSLARSLLYLARFSDHADFIAALNEKCDQDGDALSVAEQMAIWLYTDFSRLPYQLNAELRSARPTQDALKFAEVLQAALDKLPLYVGTAYRGDPKWV